MAQIRYIIDKNQSLIDIAVKYYGTIEAVAEIISLNPMLRNSPSALFDLGIDVNTNIHLYLDVALREGDEIVIEDASYITNQEVVQELASQKITTYE